MRYARMLVLQSFRCAAAAMVFAWLQTPTYAFTQVQIDQKASVGLEEAFIAQTTAQFNAKVTKNPLASHTYGMVLYGPNPSYNPPVTQAQLLQSMTDVDKFTYVYGWAAGANYQQFQEEQDAGYLGVNCSSPTVFNLTQTDSVSFDKATCEDVIATIERRLFDSYISTVPVAGF